MNSIAPTTSMGKLQKLLKGRSPEDSKEKSLPNQRLTAHNSEQSSSRTSSSFDATTETMTQRITNPSPRDVLFGRGKPFQSHPGNVYLHKIVNMHKERYLKSRRYDKLAIAEEIVSEVKEGSNGIPGRFLKRVEGEDHWVEVSSEVAREKVSHALRGKPRKLPPSSAPDGFCRPAGADAMGTAGPVNAFAMELKALQSNRMRFDEPSLHGHRSLFPSGPSVGAGPQSTSLLHSLVRRGGGGAGLSQFPQAGGGSFLPTNLDLLASRLAAANSAHLQQQRLALGGGAMNPSASLASSAAHQGSAGLAAAGGGAGTMNEQMLPGVDLALARVRAREEAITRLAQQQNMLSSSDNNFLRQHQQGRFGGSQFPR